MQFIGSYIRSVAKVLIASAVSGHNAMLLSAPGWGKTDAARMAARAMAGDEHTLTLELDPSTPPEVIHGAYLPHLMASGIYQREVKGTAYDPNAHIVVLDEIWRANDVVFDALLHATGNKNVNAHQRPVFWGTSNFVGKAERTEALRDRFALWLHLDTDLDPAAIALAHLYNGTGAIDTAWAAGMPAWDDCVRIRALTPSERSGQLVADTVRTLAEEAGKKNIPVNPRRVVQWAEILFRLSVFYTGTHDFATIPTEAAMALRWCYPAIKRETANEWAEVASAVLDAVGARIEAYRAIAMERYLAVQSQINPANKIEKIAEMGRVLAEIQAELKTIGAGDPRATEAIREFTDLFQKALTDK